VVNNEKDVFEYKHKDNNKSTEEPFDMHMQVSERIASLNES
jgi:hypothetical protein